MWFLKREAEACPSKVWSPKELKTGTQTNTYTSLCIAAYSQWPEGGNGAEVCQCMNGQTQCGLNTMQP